MWLAEALKGAGFDQPPEVAEALRDAGFTVAQVQGALVGAFALAAAEVAQILASVFG